MYGVIYSKKIFEINKENSVYTLGGKGHNGI